MTDLRHPRSAPRFSAAWRWPDMVMLTAALVWMAEATVRLPAGPLLTALFYGYFALRMAAWVLGGDGPPGPVVLALLPFPLVCLVSAFWSAAPQVSAAASVQLVFTLAVAAWAGSRFGLARLAWITLAALALALAASALNLGGRLPPAWSWEGGFLGIFTNKNALGQRAALALLTATCLALGTTGRQRAAALVAVALAAWMLALSLSVTGILLGTAAALAAIGAHAATTRRAGPLVVVLGLGGLTGAALWAQQMGIDPTAALLDAAGKSHSLTGRTVLWEVAAAKVAAAPLAGQGYMAFWAAPASLQETVILAGRYGATVQSFHNFALEVLVATGVTGLAAFALTLLVLAAWTWRAPPGGPRRWALLSLALLLALSLLGSSLYRPHEITLFLVTAIGVAARQESRAPHRSGASYSRVRRPRAAST